MIDLLSISVVFGTSLWVFIDATNIGIKKDTTKGVLNMGPTGWFFACLLCWIAAFPAYLVKRHRHMRAAVDEQADSTDGTDLMSQLAALADLSTQGLLTAEEFRTKRLQLVSRILDEASHSDLMAQLGILADLSAQDFLTDEEFQTRKRALVQRMLNESSDAGVLASN